MSWFSNYLRRRKIDSRHHTRRMLCRYVEKRGFEIGDFTYGAPQIHPWGDNAKLFIGKYCSIASNVEIFLGGNHRADWVSTFPFRGMGWITSRRVLNEEQIGRGDVRIGSDVWIGLGAVILSGVTIGDGAVIGAHAVVAKNVSPYSIVVGNPAREVRRRFPDDVIEALLAIRWWNLPDETVATLLPLIQSDDARSLIEEFHRRNLALSPLGKAQASPSAL